MRKSNGQLKFRFWDMEPAHSGGALDRFEGTALTDLIRMLVNVETDMAHLGQLPGTVGLSKYSGRRVAHVVLDVVKPTAAILTAIQNQMMRQSFFIPAQPALKAFEEVIDGSCNIGLNYRNEGMP